MEPLSDSELPPLRPSWPERGLALLATVAVGSLCAMVTLGVASRLLGRPLVPDNVLLVQELMVMVILLPLAVVTVLREHIAVTVFTRRAGVRTQRLLAALGHLVGLVFAGGLLWASARLLSRSLAAGEYYYGALDMPTWPGYAIFVVGVGAFALRLLVMLVIDLLAVLRR